MPESYIYIDAPSLDNTDQSKFVLNSDFNFVQAGDASKGSVAEFPIYGKFTNSAWRNSIASNSLPRANFKPGRWQLTQNSNINLGGDYVAGNTAQVHISNFIVGKLTKLRFRFYDKNQITDANRVEGFVHNEISNYSEVPLVYIFAAVYNADGTLANNDTFKIVALARREDNASAEDNVYILDRDFRVSPKNLTTNNFRLTFVFAPSEFNMQLDENVIYNFNDLRRCADNAKVGIRSVPRGPLDNKSYICQNGGTSAGIVNGQNRLLDFDYLIENDLIEEYLGGASSRHHLSTLDIESLNLMKYSAPQINVTNYTRKNTAAQKIFISDNSLSRNGVLKIKDEKITALQIPFTSSNLNTDYETSSLISDRFDGGGGALWHTNRFIWVWQGDGTPSALTTSDSTNIANGWIKSNELIAFSYFDVPIVYSLTFGTDGLPYKGKGIWISAHKPEQESSGRNNLAVHYYEKDGAKYAYNSSDKIYSDATNSTSELIATPDVRVVFNYKLRSDWFNYLESLVLEKLAST